VNTEALLKVITEALVKVTTEALVKVITGRATLITTAREETTTMYMSTGTSQKASTETHVKGNTTPSPETCLAREIESMTLNGTRVGMALVGGPTCSRETIVILAREGEMVSFWGQKVLTCMRRQASPSGKGTSMWIQTEPAGRPSMKTSETQCTKGGEALWAAGGMMSTVMTHGAMVMTIMAHGAPD
jgi:hypothetical protein